MEGDQGLPLPKHRPAEISRWLYATGPCQVGVIRATFAAFACTFVSVPSSSLPSQRGIFGHCHRCCHHHRRRHCRYLSHRLSCRRCRRRRLSRRCRCHCRRRSRRCSRLRCHRRRCRCHCRRSQWPVRAVEQDQMGPWISLGVSHPRRRWHRNRCRRQCRHRRRQRRGLGLGLRKEETFRGRRGRRG